MNASDISTQITQLIEQLDADRVAAIESLQARVTALEAENEDLRAKLATGKAGRFTVHDVALQERLKRLGSAPFDTIIRESGVVLEDRIRQVLQGSGANETGVRLVDLAFGSGSGAFIVSEHPGEQEGIKMLYRGAIQFIRNPPMHKLIEYPETTATLFVALIDSLLQLLDEVTADENETQGKPSPIRWSIDRLQKAYPKYKNKLLGSRLEELLGWTLTKRIFLQSTAQGPTFGIKGRMGQRVVNFSNDGSMYFHLWTGRYENAASRQAVFDGYMALGLLEPQLTLDEVHDGRFSWRKIDEFDDAEWIQFRELLDKAFG